MKPLLQIANALSDEHRIRLLLALREGELCVCQLIELLGLPPSTVSRHMSLLAQADMVLRRKQGRWHYYRLPNADEASLEVYSALAWVQAAAAETPVAKEDAARLAIIREQVLKELSACCYRS